MENNNQYGYQQDNAQGYFYQPPQPAQPTQPPQYGYQYQYQYAQQYPQYQQNAYVKPKKEHIRLEKKDSRMMLSMLILGFLFFDLALFSGFHLGYTIFYILFFIATVIYLPNKKPSLFAVLTGALSVAGSVTFAIGSNNLIKFLMFVLISGLYALFSIEISDSWNLKKGSFKGLIDGALSYVLYPFFNLPELFMATKDSAKNKKKLIAVLIGVVIALPPLMVIVPLLIKSDAAFEGLVTAIFKNIGLVILEIVLAIIFAPYLISMQLGKKHKLNCKEKAIKNYNGSIPATVGISFLSVISITYVIYLISQLAYFFSAFEGILPSDYEKTASAFARRGFFEMFVICVINVLLVSLVSFLTKKSEGNKLSGGIKGLSCFISIFSIFLIVTAIAKMKLNVETYGFTTNRLLVLTFIIMVFFAILFFIVHIFAPKVNYMQPLVVICATLFVSLALLNVDAFVANYNVRAYQRGELATVDIDNIDTTAGIPYIIELIDDDNKKVSTQAANCIVDKLSWGGYNDIVKSENDDEFEYSGEYRIDKPMDFRKYVYTDYKSYECLVDYGNSLKPSERRALRQKADKYWEYDFYQDIDTYTEDRVIEDVNEALGVDVSEGYVLHNRDTHDGALYDGLYYAEISFDEDNSCLDEIELSLDWNKVPLPENLNRMIYGEADDEYGWDYGSSILYSDDIYLSEIENGYYRFIDEDPAASDDEKSSADYMPKNFTLAIYDTDRDILYFIQYDS